MSKDNEEIDDLRRLVQELTRKNQELQGSKAGGSESKEASDELASALNALRRRVSCMDKKMDGGGGGLAGFAGRRRASSIASRGSLWDASMALGDGAAPGSWNNRVMMDLTEHREDEPPGSAMGNAFTSRSSTKSIFDLSEHR